MTYSELERQAKRNNLDDQASLDFIRLAMRKPHTTMRVTVSQKSSLEEDRKALNACEKLICKLNVPDFIFDDMGITMSYSPK
jgi:hypothetical protein